VRHYNIPIFIPEKACPFRCIYCNQYNITGKCKAPDENEVKEIINLYLSTIPAGDSQTEVAFFGGSFTGLAIKEQQYYLQLVQPYLQQGKVKGIRISTRPDYITSEILSSLKDHGVVAIELGAQSLNDDVLRASGRGHTSRDVETASVMIREMGFSLGLQMMTGLPGDDEEGAERTARKIIELGADCTRIYPTLVIKDTMLAEQYMRGVYKPQSMEEAVNLCARLYACFEEVGVKVLRTGLHSSEAFFNGETLLGGPFHPAFGELVQTRVWYNRLNTLACGDKEKELCIRINPKDLNAAIGHKALNKVYLLQFYKKVEFSADSSVNKGNFHAYSS
jgi:histone acetyltransferase (RNA polymerase elongator complex component)